jgi:hypothetical protein
MRRRLAWAVLAIAWQTLGLAAGAQAQDSGGIQCDAFAKNPDGSWTVLEKTYIPGPNVRVEAGSVFRPGGTFLGDDLALRLDKACPKVTVTVETPAPARAPQALLSRFADANGNIDVQQLNCGQLAETSPAEIDLLLAWYSGWYNGVAKKRGINLARVRYAIHNVAEFCKANRDKSLAQVMELMLK